MRVAVLLAGSLALLTSCSGFHSADRGRETSVEGGPGSDQATSGDRPRSELPDRRTLGDGGQAGPGPFGALPTGYCCSSDLECRYRRCLSSGGERMCADLCSGDGACQGAVQGFRCVLGDAGLDGGSCQPEQPGTHCIPASAFQRGTKKLGECCVATHDGRAGLECEGGHCAAFGDPSNPFICDLACSKPADCPGNYYCSATGEGYGICVPDGATYTCK